MTWRPQFSLATFFVLVTLVAAFLAWAVPAYRQAETIAHLESLGVSIIYEGDQAGQSGRLLLHDWLSARTFSFFRDEWNGPRNLNESWAAGYRHRPQAMVLMLPDPQRLEAALADLRRLPSIETIYITWPEPLPTGRDGFSHRPRKCREIVRKELPNVRLVFYDPPQDRVAHLWRVTLTFINLRAGLGMRTIATILAAILMSPSCLAAEPLGPRIEAITNAPRYAAAHWGVLVVDRKTGATIYEHQAGKLFAPASVTKVFTVAGALDALGADFRFVTPVYARGRLLADTLAGDLILRASGDLALGGRTTADGKVAYAPVEHTYAGFYDTATLTETDPVAGLTEIARQVKAAGIARVMGEVLIDDTLFDAAEGSGSGPGRITPILVNDNVVDLTITPTEPGEPAKVAMRPETGLYEVEARIQTTGKEGPLETSIRLEGKRKIIVSGTIPAGRAPLVRIFEIPDPRAWARGLLIEQLVKAGVEVTASPLADYPEKAEIPNGKNYAEMKQVAKLTSPPLGEFLRPVLKLSHNLWAGTLPLIVAANRGKRSLAEGMAVEREFLKAAGVDLGEVSFNSGAGGGRADFATPRATVTLLRHMTTRPDIAVYESSMPILGVDGTLAKHATPDNPAHGKIRAKTGTLVWSDVLNARSTLTSKALAGYATTIDGRELVFAVFVNNVPLAKMTDTEEVGRDLGRICEELVQ